MSNNKYSSVEWLSNQSYELFEQYSEGNFDRITLNKLMLKATEQAKAMHKEEIIKAYCTALPIEDGITIAINKGDDYYSKQYVDNNE